MYFRLLVLLFCVLVSSQQHGDVRLVGYGSNTLSGRIEVYYNDQWGTVCGTSKYNLLTANVVCRQLNLGPPTGITVYPDLRFGIGDGAIAITDLVCSGHEYHVLQCHYSDATSNCEHHMDIGVICSATPLPYTGEVQLTPHVQLYYDGVWQPLCRDNIDTVLGDTICRQLGYTHSVHINNNGTSAVAAWRLASANCDTAYDCVSDCVSGVTNDSCAAITSITCGYNDSLSKSMGSREQCTFNSTYINDVRMTSLSNDGFQGIPEIYTNSGWIKLCNDGDLFNLVKGDVICKQLGHTAAVRFDNAMDVTESSGIQMSCTGLETAVGQCQGIEIINNCVDFVTLRCTSGLEPYGSLALLYGAGPWGSLHVFDGALYHPICDTSFTTEELMVACRELGYHTGIRIVTNSLYLADVSAVLSTAPYNYIINCTGNEDHLLDCPATALPTTSTYCRDPYDTVAIQCGSSGTDDSGSLRLVAGNSSSGVLQVYKDGEWGTVCGHTFDHYSAHVACRQLGFQTATGYSAKWSNINSPIHYTAVSCAGHEESLLHCPHKVADNGLCDHNDDITLYCSMEYPVSDGTIRLDQTTNRLEISYHGLWMSVCGRLFSHVTADVACRELGYNYTEDYCTKSCNASGEGPIYFAEISCTSNEEKLIACEKEWHNDGFCTHDDDVTIFCSTHTVTSPPTVTTPPDGGVNQLPDFLSQIIIYAVVGSVAVVLLVVTGVVCVCCCICCCRRKQNLSDVVEAVSAPPTTNHVYNGSSPSSSDDSLPEIVKEKERRVTSPPPVGGGGIDEVDFEAPPCYDEIEQRSLPRRLCYTGAAVSASPNEASFPCEENTNEKAEKLELQCDYDDDL